MTSRGGLKISRSSNTKKNSMDIYQSQTQTSMVLTDLALCLIMATDSLIEAWQKERSNRASSTKNLQWFHSTPASHF